MTLLERLGVELPIVQAGMGGGVARSELAAAVSAAGGLGTLGLLAPPHLGAELAAARERTPGPLAVNLLLPFARRAHWEVAAGADLVVTFWGAPRRRTPRTWVHQCGSVGEVKAAVAAGADGVIVQGVEAGGHVRGTRPALELLERALAAVAPGYPVWLAGGVADREGVRRALDAGAEAAVLGTRFLMSEESRAHPAYKARVASAEDTVLTELFGSGWPAPHRVVLNAATRRWLRRDQRGPRLVRAVNRVTGPVVSRAPGSLAARAAASQRPGVPLLGPQPPVDDGPDTLVEAGPLYAGETVRAIDDVRPAGALVSDLAG